MKQILVQWGGSLYWNAPLPNGYKAEYQDMWSLTHLYQHRVTNESNVVRYREKSRFHHTAIYKNISEGLLACLKSNEPTMRLNGRMKLVGMVKKYDQTAEEFYSRRVELDRMEIHKANWLSKCPSLRSYAWGDIASKNNPYLIVTEIDEEFGMTEAKKRC